VLLKPVFTSVCVFMSNQDGVTCAANCNSANERKKSLRGFLVQSKFG